MHQTELLLALKEADQDFEFYPTTNKIIEALAADLNHHITSNEYNWRRNDHANSMLDIGAGNGKVLAGIKAHAGRFENLGSIRTFYAIEKSPILCGAMPDDIFVIGTDFLEQSLMSKTASITYSNPPYKQFEQWAERIIRQSASRLVYLLIPDRWEKSQRITEALAFRSVTAKIVGNYDFENSEDRTARARVHLLRIDYGDRKETAFQKAFQEEFADFIKAYESAPKETARDAVAAKVGEQAGLVRAEDIPAMLVQFYNEAMQATGENYAAASRLDPAILKEFDIDPNRIMGCLQERLTGLRSVYWDQLFSRILPITSRLTADSRQKLLDTLSANRNVDFTLGNIHAVVVWALKNANRFIGSQLVDTYENLVDKANVKMYASNHRAFVDGWRHQREEPANTHYALEYRIITHRVGGISGSYGDYKFRDQGISDRAGIFLNDLMTVASTLGFQPTADATIEQSGKWTSGESKTFDYTAPDGKRRTLLSVRAFQNGNLHIKMDPKFVLALNVEHGRLKGWIRTPKEAAEELQDPTAPAAWNTTFQLPTTGPLLIA